MIAKSVFSVVAATLIASSANAATAPSEIKIGTLYATAGNYASLSTSTYSGLKFWVDQENARGGVFVKPYNKRIPIKLVAYDDQSNPATAGALYNRLVTQDKVDVLIADSGTVLTAPAVQLARNYKRLLIDQTGTSGSFFSKDNPYIVLTADPVSTDWPRNLANFLIHDGPKLGIKRIALLYDTNEFSGTEANSVRDLIKKSGAPLEFVYDQGVPTGTTNYTVLINNIKATNPDAVIQMGYPNNDTAFLRSLQANAVKFKFVFNAFTGLETDHLLQTVGANGMAYTTTYVAATNLSYKPTVGLSMEQYKKAWEAANKGSKVAFGDAAVVGYTTGLVVENALRTTDSLEQLALRKAIGDLSGKITTLDGEFKVDDTGAQIGETMMLGQFIPNGKDNLKISVIYPHDFATGKIVYPAK